MGENQVDRLEIEVQAQAQKANTALDGLVSKLEKMSASLSRINAGGIKNMAVGIDRLSASMKSMNGVKTGDFTRLANNIQKIGNANTAGIANTAAALRTISSALTATSGMSDGAAQIANLASSISRLGYKTVANATTNLPLLANGLQQFSQQLSKISAGTGASSAVVQQITDLSNAIAKFGYKSMTNAITNLPLLANAMTQFMSTLSTAPNVSQNIIQMTQAMANLAAQGAKYGSTIKSMASATNTLTKSQSAFRKTNFNSFMAGITKLTVAFYILRKAIRAAWEPVQQAMDFGETVNLFQTSFKKIGMEAAQDAGMEWGSDAAETYALGFIDRAQDFNNRIVDALSLDPETMMRYQAMFGQIANAMGLATDTAMNMSESLTLLGNDLASLFNTDTAAAMEKLQAGITGQVKPLREWGIDITEATLKNVALEHGITDTVSEMTQAQKAQLRWLAIMDQSSVAFGDMAKTIDNSEELLLVA